MDLKTCSKRHIDKTFVKQHDQTDCGVACLLSIIRFYGSDESLEKLREASGTLITGTTLLGLYQCALALGFDVKGVEVNLNYLKEQAHPCILHVLIDGNLQHYIVYYGIKPGEIADGKTIYLIGNPEKGVMEIGEDELSNIWVTKTALLLKPGQAFKQNRRQESSKWVWFKQAIRPDLSILAITIILGLFITILGISIAIFYQKLIDDILPQSQLNKLISGSILLLMILLSKSCLNFLRQHFILMQSKNFNERITGSFLKALFFLPKSFFDHRKTGDMTARLNDTQRIQKNIAYIAGTICIDVMVIVATLAMLFVYSVTIGLVCVFFIPVVVSTVLSFIKPIKKEQKNVMIAYGSTESSYVDHIQGISTIKEYNREFFFTSLNKQIFGFYQEASILLGNLGNKFSFTSEFLGVVMQLSILLAASYLVIGKQLKIGEMVAILSLVSSFLPSVHRLALSPLQIQEAKVAFDRMYEFASINPEFIVKDIAAEKLQFSKLEVKNISFGFPGRKLILKDISFHIDKGEFIVLLGETGCGKSTILQLLKLFYNPIAGQIFINDIVINDYYIPVYRDIISTVPQEIKLFNTSLIENITLDKTPEAMDNVYAFSKEYGFDKYFAEFPQGYLTVLGEDGNNLSGGQKQLVALARALYKKPQLLLLDEATSAMDKNTEQFAFSLLQRLRDEIAIVMVTHRINTVKMADRIYIIEDGLIIENGTHSSLMKKQNLYSDALLEYGT